MPTLHYKARTKDGKDTEGDRDVGDRFELARALRSEGLTVLSVEENSSLENIKESNDLMRFLPDFLQRIPLTEKINFTRNTGVMVGAGISLARALHILQRQVKTPRFKKAVTSITRSVEGGESFADAMGNHKSIFPSFYREMIRAGEKSGKLQESLDLISTQLQRDYTLRRRVRSALMYPSIILIAMIGIGILMLIFVVPTLVSTFDELDVELPASTRFVIAISNSLLGSGILIFVSFLFFAYGVFYAAKTIRGKHVLDWMFLHVPVIKTINQKFNTARTCRVLSSLIASGVNMLEALTITKNVLQNHYYKEVIENAEKSIQKGKKIAESVSEAEKVYPPLVGEMIAVGEETGKLSDMLLRLAVFYESEVADATKDLSTIIEPVLMILIGIFVGFFAVSMISPMYNLVGAF